MYCCNISTTVVKTFTFLNENVHHALMESVPTPKACSFKNLKMVAGHLPETAAHEVCVFRKSNQAQLRRPVCQQGWYAATPSGSFIPGLEFSGIIVGTGSAVTERKNGDRVIGATKFGASVS